MESIVFKSTRALLHIYDGMTKIATTYHKVVLEHPLFGSRSRDAIWTDCVVYSSFSLIIQLLRESG